MIWKWLATRAASGWIALAGFGLLTTAYVAYDLRGDKIVELERDLRECEGNPRQTRAIEKLSEKVTEQLQERADDEIDRLKAIPDGCYRLDGPSPLNDILREPGTAEGAAVPAPSAGSERDAAIRP